MGEETTESGLRAQIRLKDSPAGLLERRADGSTVFTYEAGWAEPIGCALPTSTTVYAWPNGVHPFFQHLTSEGWLRERQARLSVLDQGDDFGLLLKYGRDCIGAVSVHAVQSVDQNANSPTASGIPEVQVGRTVSGMQKKVLALKTPAGFAAAGPEGPAPYIAKFNSNDLPTLVRNEALSLELARTLLGREHVTVSTVSDVVGFGTALVVTRFDRTQDGGKLRLEDFAQILNIPRGVDNNGKYASSYEAVGGALAQFSARPEIDCDRYFRLVVANALLCNCDAHLKNFSLLETNIGLRLSPAYDVVNTLFYWREGYSTQFSLEIDGQKRQHDQLTASVFRAFGRNIGLPDSAIKAALTDLEKRAAKVIAILRSRMDTEREPSFATQYHDVVAPAIHRIFAGE